jgi:hypothetical protein
MLTRRVAGIVVLVSFFVVPAVADAQTRAETAPLAATAIANPFLQPARLVEEQFSVRAEVPRPALERPQAAIGSKATLASLYVTTATMQMLDVDSTLKALNRGATEVNPLMSGVVRNRAAFVAVKAGVAAATIYAAHRMARGNRVAAIATMVAINSAYALIVSHNYRIANR